MLVRSWFLSIWTTHENDQQCLSRFDGLVSELELKPIPDLICWLLVCKGKMTELCSFHFDPHFWGIFFRCYYVVPYALVSYDVPFTVIRFNGNYLKTEMLKLFRNFKGKMLEVEKITRQHCQICLNFRIGNCENTITVESVWQNTQNI